MSDLSSTGLYLGGAAAINAVGRIGKGADPVPGLIASGLLFGLFAIVGSMWRSDVFKMIAAVMLLYAVLLNGLGFFQALSKLTTGLSTGTRKVVVVPGGSTGKGSSASAGAGNNGGGGGF